MSTFASGPLSAENVPVWLAWVVAVGGAALMIGTVYWMTPPYRRRQTVTQHLSPAVGLLVVVLAIGRRNSGQLLLGGGVLAVAALPLFWMGKLPADMPSSQDRSIGRHPEYLRVARRGRIAGVAIVVLEIAWIATLTALS
ncbi:hypothetical protein [Paractinoplanes durhamensis]|uniref:Uncharacterized protein n=1 Tax=Paractinoplanes durhamensis TaxID=113563 RepID=A0ABQ3YWP5_9ACTN|nr:hypothetical protein [Actinoplanes durhamensis]GIE02014.1 hypothetical protein Adu01nite_33640 [Actinoplanes durhamensis]